MFNEQTNVFSISRSIFFIKAMDQPGHVTRFLLYRNFSLSNSISIKIKTDNWKFVEFNKIH